MQKAIDACTAAGGGTVVFPPGRYRLSMVSLKDNVTLQFEKESFVDAPRLYSEYTPLKFLFRAAYVTNVVMRGPVIINGQGSNYWNVVPNPTTWYSTRQSVPVPLVQFRSCSNVVVDGITIVNTPSWALSPYSSTNVTIRNVTIINDLWGPNTDGINVCQSKNVLITGCRVSTGDDPIAIKNMDPVSADNFSSNITITNCDLTSPSYSLKIGTESRVGVIENIIYTDCRTYPHRGDLGNHTGIALESMDGGILRNVRVTRIQSVGVRAPIFIRLGNRGDGQAGPPFTPGKIQDVIIEDVYATGVSTNREFGIEIHGLPSMTVSNILLRNITIIPRGDVRFSHLGVTNVADLVVPEKEADYPSVDMFGWMPSFGLFCRHAQAITLQNLNLLPQNPDVRPALAFNDVSGLSISNVVAGYPNMTNRTGASMYFVTNSPSITITATTNLNTPPGGYILSTP
ncbi:exo-poly-alpha-D-galacturonosidase [Verrucomicrobiota bacterium]|nr:exo-poly-alpha-D-galacturonosidase [Verrucomicrobiota bacterium]